MIYDRLRSAVSALGGRVYPLLLPQNVRYPAAVYRRISATRYSAFGRDAAAAEAVIQVDVYGHRSQGYGAFATVADAVRRAIQRFSDTSATPPVYDTFIEAERDDYEENTELFRKSFDIRPWYQES